MRCYVNNENDQREETECIWALGISENAEDFKGEEREIDNVYV